MNTVKHSFFCPNINDCFLSEEESNHAVRVLRLKTGDKITVIDGKGMRILAEITTANKKRLEFKICETTKIDQVRKGIHIAIAPTKNMDRFTFFVEKTIEIGIDRITPILTKNSERKNLNIEKVRKGAIGALKQSGNLYLPLIDDLTEIGTFIDSVENEEQKFIGHLEEDGEKKALKNEINVDKKVIILIGPEGDFTPEEIKLAKQNNFTPVSLGESTLRTETAGIVACHTVHIIS